MNRYLSLLIILCALLAGCKKEKADPNNPDDPYNPPSYTYLPLTVGDTWNYIHNGDNKDTISSTVGRESYFVNDHLFSYVVSSNGVGLYTQIGNEYYMVVNDMDVDIPVPILDDGGAYVSETDSADNVPGGSPRIDVSLSTEDYNSKTVNGKTYDTVIHTRLELQFPDDDLRAPENYDFYFARNIGIIELDKGYYGGVDDTQTLIDFTYDPTTTLAHRLKKAAAVTRKAQTPPLRKTLQSIHNP